MKDKFKEFLKGTLLGILATTLFFLIPAIVFVVLFCILKGTLQLSIIEGFFLGVTINLIIFIALTGEGAWN